MKKVTGALALLMAVVFISCRKNTVKPDTASGNNTQQMSAGTNSSDGKGTTSSTITDDSLNNVKGLIRLQIAEDSINTDNILLNFDPNSQTIYTPGIDAPTLDGFGKVSLSSISSDDMPLSIYTLPLTYKGDEVRLRVNARSDGIYSLNLEAIQSIPQVYDLWLMDGYKKDSVEMRYNRSYAFNIIKSDTSSYGVTRFKLVIRTR